MSFFHLGVVFHHLSRAHLERALGNASLLCSRIGYLWQNDGWGLALSSLEQGSAVGLRRQERGQRQGGCVIGRKGSELKLCGKFQSWASLSGAWKSLGISEWCCCLGCKKQNNSFLCILELVKFYVVSTVEQDSAQAGDNFVCFKLKMIQICRGYLKNFFKTEYFTTLWSKKNICESKGSSNDLLGVYSKSKVRNLRESIIVLKF